MYRPNLVLLLMALAVLHAAPAWTQQAGAVLTIWKIGSPHRGDVPSADLPTELALRARRQGLTLRVDAFPAEGFAARFFAAVKRGAAPDIVAFDNVGLVNGITTQLGTFAGIGQDPAVRRDLVEVRAAFDEILQPGRGWAFAVKSSPRHRAAVTLALGPPSCPVLRAAALGPADLAPVASLVAKAHLTGDFSGVQHYVDPERVRGFAQTASGSRVETTVSCGIWGNARLAFALQKASFDTGSTVGHASLLLVFRRPASTWQLLGASRDPVSTGPFLTQVAAMASVLRREAVPGPAPGRAPGPATLIAPADGAFPAPRAGQRFGDFVFRPSGGRAAIAHIAEFAYNDDVRLFLVPAGADGQGRVSAGQLWTVKGPWTWRVWSIAPTGEVVFSETRTFTH